MANLKGKGVVSKLYDVEEIPSKNGKFYKKRVIVVEAEVKKGNYNRTTFHALDAWGDMVYDISKFKSGDEVVYSFRVESRQSAAGDRWFSSMSLEAIDKVGEFEAAEVSVVTASEAEARESSKLKTKKAHSVTEKEVPLFQDDGVDPFAPNAGFKTPKEKKEFSFVDDESTSDLPF